jgi:phosphotriesterase family protein
MFGLALSLVLMVAAGLLTRSFWDVLDARLGFDATAVTTAHAVAVSERRQHRQIPDDSAGGAVASRPDPPGARAAGRHGRCCPAIDMTITNFVPRLKRAGVDDRTLRMILVENPRRVLTIAPRA